MDFVKRRALLLKWGQWLSEIPAQAVMQEEIQRENLWFTPASVAYACDSWVYLLRSDRVDAWLAAYPDLQERQGERGTVGLILAGNIPLVGLHDVLCALMSGLRLRIKMSSKDSVLLTYLLERSYAEDEAWRPILQRVDGLLGGVDGVIVTGSRETAAVFQEYFSTCPHLIRGHRNSCAVVRGEESDAELFALAEDMFRYYGLGCRNVTLLFVPHHYSVSTLVQKLSLAPICTDLREHSSYQNNYVYQRALAMMGKGTYVDGGTFLMRENASFSPPIGLVHYQTYRDDAELVALLTAASEQLQCVVGALGSLLPTQDFGQAQRPGLGDYADAIDTLHFLRPLYR